MHAKEARLQERTMVRQAGKSGGGVSEKKQAAAKRLPGVVDVGRLEAADMDTTRGGL